MLFIPAFFPYDRDGRRSNDYFPHLDTHYRNYAYPVMDDRLMKAGKRETGEVFEFTHDEEGRREAKYCNGELVEAYHWLDFLRMDGFHDGESAYRVAYRDGERTPHAMEREEGTTASLFYDQAGSLRVVADASGNMIKEVLYDRLRRNHRGLQSGLSCAHRLCRRPARPGPWFRPLRVERLRHVHQPLDRARSPGRRGRRPGLVWLLFGRPGEPGRPLRVDGMQA